MKVSFRRTERAEVRVQRLGSWNVLRWSATGRRRGPLAFSANVDLGHVQKHIQTRWLSENESHNQDCYKRGQ